MGRGQLGATSHFRLQQARFDFSASWTTPISGASQIAYLVAQAVLALDLPISAYVQRRLTVPRCKAAWHSRGRRRR
jgi:hypothetical protein